MSALLVAAAVWLLVPGTPAGRARALYLDRPVRRPDLAGIVTVLVPVASVVVLGWWTGLLASVVLVPVARGFVAGLETSARRRREAELLRQLPAALDLLASALDAGRPPSAALALVRDVVDDPLAGELAVVVARLRSGGDPRAVWGLLAEDRVLGPLGRAFGRADASGMPVAEVIESVARESRRERRAAARERSRRVGVRTAAPLGACFLPAFFLVGVVPTIIGVVSGLDVL